MNPVVFRCLGLAAALVLPLSGNVTVTTATDEDNGSLDPGTGAGTSLREAVAHAPAGSVIDFAAALSGQTITLTGGQISFGKNLTLDASALAGGVTISGNDASRVFDIPSSRVVAMTRLKIVHGDSSGDGGGLRNAGTLSLTDCELTDHHADDGGGAIENSGPLTATACTFAGNTAGVGGGAIEHTANTLALINCTLTGNTADFGGAIDGDGTSTIQLRSSTVSGNHATNDGGGLEETTGTLVLENTIVAGNTADDEGPDLKASGINIQNGKNLLSSTAGMGGSFYGIVALPQLSALGAYGGFTRTMTPLAGSPAINAGGSTTLTVDQRGLPRVAGGTVDIGSVEIQASNQVITTTDSGPGSLRQVVQDAPAGSTVTFAATLDLATITLASPIVLAKNLTLDAADRDGLTISGGDATGLFTVNAGVSVAIAGLHLRDGAQPAGGAIRNLGTLALTDCVVSSGDAFTGGGVSNATGATLTLTDCELAQNLASHDGGGLHNQGTATLTRVTVVGNRAGEDGGSGGGIYSTGVLTLIELVVNGNGAPHGGGLFSSGTVTLDRVSVLENDAWDGSGGGLVASGNGGTITASTFSENRTIGSGGGLYHGGGDLTIINSTWAGNVSEYEFGGAIAARAPEDLLDVVSCTFSDNEAGEEGGGIHVQAGSRLRLENSILSSNTAPTAGADLRGAIETQAGVNLVSSSAGIDGAFGGIVAPSLLGALADHGGPTWTMLPAAGSPAIDAGGPTSLTVDQRGLPRVVGTATDLGAVEVQGGPTADTWESLAETPFPHGVSAGGGLATDGHHVYAADLSGDGDGDFIDLDDDGLHDAGESLADLGIANASVRFARFDPLAGVWQSLPSIIPAGFTGDTLSRHNFTGSLFHADGWLYYYQFRGGADRCVLHRYFLGSAPAGAWEVVWDKSPAEALIDRCAGMVGLAGKDGPVILHHRGNGVFDFCRSSGLESGGEHLVLTPQWYFDTHHFPNHGAWDFDPLRGRLYHLSGDRLMGWSPSTTYKNAGSPYDRGSFLTTDPVAGSPLALVMDAIPSLKATPGWDPGGSAAAPGSSLWGNSITVVNDPSGLDAGPAGEDTGANVVYLVRGETTPDAAPFNDGRGRVNNGDFARWFATTGNCQTLAAAPFPVGKGSDSVYLGGYLYLTQGETRNSADGAGSDAPIRDDGIRRPGKGFARFRIQKTTAAAADDDISVAWIQRLPALDYEWNSPQPDIEGWPAAGSTVTWRAMVKNWSPVAREDVGYRWLLDGTVIGSGTVDLLVGGYTAVDLPWTWAFARHGLAFEIDPANTLAEVSEQNNRVETWTDAITAGFWIEHSFYRYMHDHQQDLGIGSNGFEDWAQRQVGRWNQAYAAAAHPVDCPQGVLDRVRLDKIVVVADGMLPLTGDGDYRTNKPDKADRSVDIVWGFPSWNSTTALGQGYLEPGSLMEDTTTISDYQKPFYYDGVLFHETSHARYLLDVYGFRVEESGTDPGNQILITQGGQEVVGTAYMPLYWDNAAPVYYVHGLERESPFFGLMHGPWTYVEVDRYSAMALNLIAGRRAVSGNYNSPGNLGVFLNDLPDQNTVQLTDGHGVPLPGATVTLYRAVPTYLANYGKRFDDIADASFTADANGCIEVGRNPFSGDSPLLDVARSVAILRVDHGGRTGFGFLPAGLFNMEFWRGNSAHGRHSLAVAMLGAAPDIAGVLAWTENGNPEVAADERRRLRIVLSGVANPGLVTVTVDGQPAQYDNGAWWFITATDTNRASSVVTATWPGGPTLSQTVFLDDPVVVPQLFPEKIPAGLRVGWWSRAGYRYQAEHSENLIDWTPAGAIHFGTGGWMEADDPGAGARGFTRLEASRLTD